MCKIDKEYKEIKLKKDSDDPKYIIKVENYYNPGNESLYSYEEGKSDLYYFKKNQARLLENISREKISDSYRIKSIREYLFNEIKWIKGDSFSVVGNKIAILVFLAGMGIAATSLILEPGLQDKVESIIALIISTFVSAGFISLELIGAKQYRLAKENLEKLNEYEKEEAELVLSKKLI